MTKSTEPRVVVTATRVDLVDGTTVALIEAVTIGGGVQVVTVDGVPEERQHPTFERWHCRLLSPDRMIADQLVEKESYDEAVKVGLTYAGKRAKHATQLAELAAELQA